MEIGFLMANNSFSYDQSQYLANFPECLYLYGNFYAPYSTFFKAW